MVFPFERLPSELKSKVICQVYLEARQRPGDIWNRHMPSVSREFNQLCAKYRFEVSFSPACAEADEAYLEHVDRLLPKVRMARL